MITDLTTTEIALAITVGMLFGGLLLALGGLSYHLFKRIINWIRFERRFEEGTIDIAIVDFPPERPFEYKGQKHPGLILIKPHEKKDDSDVIAEVEDTDDS